MRLPLLRNRPTSTRQLADNMIADRRWTALKADISQRTRIAAPIVGALCIGMAATYAIAINVVDIPRNDPEITEQASNAFSALTDVRDKMLDVNRAEIDPEIAVRIAENSFSERSDGGYSVEFSFEDGFVKAHDLKPGACDVLQDEVNYVNDYTIPYGPGRAECDADTLSLRVGRLEP